MKFDRLRLSGFKSFVEPTELLIRDGLTGVVGPNGCGKSNLLEALRWVMGESSPKSMRGGGMEDVIFAGTARRPPRNLADVTLTIDNRQRRAPPALNNDDVLEVHRRIERDDGSTYRVNGREVRQRDVQLLFADAATGANSPALVSQNRVAALINARPAERRLLLEEAAGISGLHVRREEAETRLRAAETNLARLADVMSSAEAQANTLRRQAKAAQKYRALAEAIRATEARLLVARWRNAFDALAAADRALAAADADLQVRSAEAERLAAEHGAAATGLPALRAAEAEKAAVVQRLTTAQATLTAERTAAVQRLADMDAALKAANAEAEREAGRIADSSATQARLQTELRAAEAAAVQAAAEKEPAEAATRAAEAHAADGERALAVAVEAHAAVVAEARQARAAADAARQRADRLTNEAARIMRECDALRNSRAVADGQSAIVAAETMLASLNGRIAAALAAIEAAEAERRAAVAAREAVEKALSGARSEVTSLTAEMQALERLAQGAGTKGAARLPLQAAPGFEAALAGALGEDASAEAGPPAANGKPLRRWLGAIIAGDDPALPDEVLPLARHVTAPPELARRLAQVGVVERPPDAALLSLLKTGQRLVMRDGSMWRWDGFHAPPGGAGAAVAETLRQANRLAELRAALAPATARLAEAEAELATQRAAESAANQAEARARSERREAESARDREASRLQGLRNAAQQTAARIEAMNASIARLGAEGEQARAEAETAAAAVAALPDPGAVAQGVAVARSEAERARSALAAARAHAAGIVRTAVEAEGRAKNLLREIAEWQARDARAADQAAALKQRILDLQAQRTALAGAPDAMAARLKVVETELKVAASNRAAAGDAVRAAEAALGEQDRAARAATAAVADAREARARLAAEAEHGRAKVQALHAECVERFGIGPRKLPEAMNFADEAVDPAMLAGELDRMSAERERLGAVNLRADIELEEIDAELTRQRNEAAELETAINRLRGSIGNLNREGRLRLLEAFKAVDGHFRDLFVTLFGGGAAELTLTESDDPLDAGLEIMAQPPGKRLQSLSLLSGGEQALTACALIFALFLTNPAPICVLDEVDAPLDDANVERFCNLLDHMTQVSETRFLIVTHNAVTMSRMHRLFGVTMGEPGVSQLVSVELQEAEALLQAA